MKRFWRRQGPTVLLVAGMAMAAAGVALWSAAAGLIVGGVELIALAVLSALGGGEDEEGGAIEH